jgi:reductive dehalogenase
VPSLNDSALAIPLAIKAGLGEYGRHGLLITKEFGPRVRLGKVFTDLPLAHDRPIAFGVRAFCEICRRCTDACPPKAIPDGGPSTRQHNVSNLRGVAKWSVDAEKCFGFWAGQNSDCSICIRVCPYNKDFRNPMHRVGRWLAGTRWRRLMLRLDGWMAFGRRMRAAWWWGAPAEP